MRVLAAMGVTDVRLTGGEPLVRREFPRLVVDARARATASRTSRSPPTATCSSATRRRSSRPGITRVNVSIDSLQRDRFFQLTRRDSLPQVLRGLEAIGAHPEVRPIKVNAVALRGFTEEEALPFAEFARSTSYQVRFIEFMPLDGDHAWSQRPGAAGRRDPRDHRRASTRSRSCRASRTRPRACSASPTARGEIGFINPVSEPFCADCNRIRLTADGKLRTCLFSIHETDLREPLRDGAERRGARGASSATPSGARS